MLKLQEKSSPKTIAIWLDHLELIGELYRSSPSMSTQHQLRQEIFHYLRKHSTEISERSRKRKKSSNPVEENSEIHALREKAEMIIKMCQDEKLFKEQPKVQSAIDRVWEELHTFPKFKGENNTNKVQKFPLVDKEYLIPPMCKFFNNDILQIDTIAESLGKFDLIVMDPPWRNKYIRRIKKAKRDLGYDMLENDLLEKIPLDRLLHSESLVVIWCTNSRQHQSAITEKFLPAWNLNLLAKWHWLKLNSDGSTVCEFSGSNQKQPFETLYVACHVDSKRQFEELKNVELILSVPSIIHSHKPPLLRIFENFLPHENPKCLELFARYLQPNFTSIGLEVLKLMDVRLYDVVS